MKAIRSAQVTCDDCGKSLVRMAPPRTKHTALAERRALRDLARYARRRRWQMEGTSLMAGDPCNRCRIFADMAHDDVNGASA